jgi:hypothetical protein
LASDLPAGVERPVVAVETRIAVADQGEYLAGGGVGRHGGHLQLGQPALLGERVALRADGRLGRHLHRRVHGGEDAQPVVAQHVLGVIALQLAAHHVQKGRVAGHGEGAALHHAQRLGLFGRHLFGRQMPLLAEQAQRQIAPRRGALGVPPRVVIGRRLHHAGQQRELPGVEFAQRAAEVQHRALRRAVHAARADLPEEHLVQVRLEDVVLAVVRFQQHRHDGFGELAPHRAIGGQEIVLHQLLRERAAALHHRAGAHVRPQRPGDGAHRHAVVLVKVPVFQRQQRLDQGRRHLRQADQQAVLVAVGVEAADELRLQPQQRQLALVAVDARHLPAIEANLHLARWLRTVPELEPARVDEHTRPAHGIRADTLRFTALIAQTIERLDQARRVQRQAGVELERPGEHARRQCPALTLELVADDAIEVHRVQRQPGDSGQGQRQQPAEPTATGRTGARFGHRRRNGRLRS